MDNFDLRKYLTEGRLFKEDNGSSISLTPEQREDFISSMRYLAKEEDVEYALGESGNVLARILTDDEAEFIEDVEDFGYNIDEVEEFALDLAGKILNSEEEEINEDFNNLNANGFPSVNQRWMFSHKSNNLVAAIYFSLAKHVNNDESLWGRIVEIIEQEDCTVTGYVTTDSICEVEFKPNQPELEDAKLRVSDALESLSGQYSSCEVYIAGN